MQSQTAYTSTTYLEAHQNVWILKHIQLALTLSPLYVDYLFQISNFRRIAEINKIIKEKQIITKSILKIICNLTV
jgi:hypothetical protein